MLRPSRPKPTMLKLAGSGKVMLIVSLNDAPAPADVMVKTAVSENGPEPVVARSRELVAPRPVKVWLAKDVPVNSPFPVSINVCS